MHDHVYRNHQGCLLTSTYCTCSYSDAQGKPISLLKDAQFKRVRDVLKAKRIGKGQKPNRSKALSLEEEEVFWEKGVFGTGTPH